MNIRWWHPNDWQELTKSFELSPIYLILSSTSCERLVRCVILSDAWAEIDFMFTPFTCFLTGDLDSSIESECETPFTMENSLTEPAGNSASATVISRNKVRCDFSNMAKPGREILNRVEELANSLTPSTLSKVPTDHLLRIHMHLGTMMSNVALAMKGKCPVSPTSSQSSQ